MDRINLGEMPPEGEPKPDAEQVRQVASWIAGQLRQAERMANAAGGQILLRRMNKAEYVNTIRDLLGMKFPPGEGPVDSLPADREAEGFDKVATALSLDSSLLERYFQAGRYVADRAIVDGPPEYPTAKMRLEPESDGPEDYASPDIRWRENGIVVMGPNFRTWTPPGYPGHGQKTTPVPGFYRVSIRAGAYQGDLKTTPKLSFQQKHKVNGQGFIADWEIDAPLDHPKVYSVVVPRDGTEGPWFLDFVQGQEFFGGPVDNRTLGSISKRAREENDVATTTRLLGRELAEGLAGYRRNPDIVDFDKQPRVFIDWIEFEGPLYDQWPPKSHQTLMFRGEGAPEDLDYAREIFERFLPQAYRRPIEPAEATPFVELVRQELGNGLAFRDALRAGVAAVLSSPKFIYLVETQATEPQTLNDYEIASRLSYFLWSSMPDKELIDLAAEGKLRDKQVLETQVDRMIADPKIERLTDSFATQWVHADEFLMFTPDPQVYKDYEEKLGESMVEQPREFFRVVLQHDRPAKDFLDSDWTTVDGRLAKFYGLEGIKGDAFTVVELPADSKRGGLLGMAGIAVYGSDGLRTKPVTRGKYVREVLFNDPPDPPPPNAGEIEPNIKGENLTVRDRLLQHQQIEACAACHRGIDPYGLALENFNVVGQWRTKQDGEDFGRVKDPPEIVVDGTLPSGETYQSYDEFKQFLVGQKDRFHRGLVEKLMTYALGRPVLAADRATIDRIVGRMEQEGGTLRGALKGLVTSDIFLSK